MRYEQRFYNLIYDYFFMRLQVQYFKYGDQLPSIDSLRREFSVSDQTVKTALRRLREQRYISMHNGRPTKVIFRQSEEMCDEYILHFFEERSAALLDLSRTAEFIFTPLLLEGFRRIDKKGFTVLSGFARRAEPDDMALFYCYILQKLDNPLIMNLFWEVTLFQGFPAMHREGRLDLYDIHLAREELEEIISCGEMQEWERLEAALRVFPKVAAGKSTRYIEKYVRSVPEEEQLPFVWRIYRDHPQVCYSLAARILHEIYLGQYRGMEFLPSYNKMAKEYGVSVSTIRRTVHVLVQLGAVSTVNGKGTSIISLGECGRMDFENPAVRRIMAFFFQAFELMVYCCEEVARCALSAMDGEAKGKLAGRLREYISRDCCELALGCVSVCFINRAPLLGIREIYQKIYGLCLSGGALNKLGGDFPGFKRASLRFTRTAVECLESNDIDRFAAALKEFAAGEFSIVERSLARLGFQPEELRLSPSIRLSL